MEVHVKSPFISAAVRAAAGLCLPVLLALAFVEVAQSPTVTGLPAAAVEGSNVEEAIYSPPLTSSLERVELLAKNERAVNVPVLMYHYIRVNPTPNDTLGLSLSVSPEDFEKHAAYLAKKGYNTITPTHLIEGIRGRQELPAKPILLTFDDGYQDFYTAALPILKKYNLKATLFVVTNLVGKPNYVSWPMLHDIVQSGLVSIESHGLDHDNMTAKRSDLLTRQLVASKEVLEQTLGIKVNAFCYPAGRSNSIVEAAVNAAGYQLAFSTRYGRVHEPASVFSLPRLRVDGGSPYIERMLGFQ
ncbi:MAG: polysaccharide deacetylase family protein [Dehalococcoidia bacterium]|nr:polysaccharide deacetylase family protein [Dehalococcoidia bacterium]